MKFNQLSIDGAWEILGQSHRDERGSFTRLWCVESARKHGLPDTIDHYSESFNRKAGTLRGMHYQAAPFPESKWIRCSAGSVYDVLLDVRPQSTSFGRWLGFHLTDQNNRQLYVPEGIAHGFLTLQDNSVVQYGIAGTYHLPSARGIRWDDPAFQIDWPRTPTVMSERDASYALFESQDSSPQSAA